MDWKTVVVVGAGYVGLATAAALASGELGQSPEVTVWDVNPERIRAHREDRARGRNPLGEPRMAEALQDVNLVSPPEYDLEQVLELTGAKVVVCAVGTPLAPEGDPDGIDCRAVLAVAAVVIPLAKRLDLRAFVVRSTITPNCAWYLRQVLAHTGMQLFVIPEFLREGHAVDDAINPTRLVIGCDDLELGNEMAQAMDGEGRPAVLKTHLLKPEEAALAKLGSNAMLTLRAWFANRIAGIVGEWEGGDVEAVLCAIGSDPRIGMRHLAPSLGVGGPCLPKDYKALMALSRYPLGERDPIGSQLLLPVDAVVQRIKSWWKTQPHWEDHPVPAVTVAGVGFKPQSPDWRGAPALQLILELYREQFHVNVWDDRLELEQWRTQDNPARELVTILGDVPGGRAAPFPGDVLVLNRPLEGLLWNRLQATIEAGHRMLIMDPHRFLVQATVQQLEARGLFYWGWGRGRGWTSR